MPPGGRPWRVGWLTPGEPGGPLTTIEAFAAGMRDKGWVRDEHYVLDIRATNDARQYEVLAGELVARAPDVLMGIETTSLWLRQFTTAIPIVMLISIDPVAAGLIRSLARPGTNVTGMSGQFDAIVAKWIEALGDIVPGARRIAILVDASWSDSLRRRAVLERAARSKGVVLDVVAIDADEASLGRALRDIEQQRPDGLVIPIQGAPLAHAVQIRDSVRRLRLPAVGLLRAGAVVQIGPDFQASARESADFVDRIFRGARPADLPVRQPRRWVTTVNVGFARELGIVLPASVLARADRLVE